MISKNSANMAQNVLILVLVVIVLCLGFWRVNESKTVEIGVSQNSEKFLRANQSNADGLAGYYDYVFQCDMLADMIADAITDHMGLPNSSGISEAQGPELIDEWARMGCGIDMTVPS